MSSRPSEPDFDWQQIDHALANLRLLQVSEEMRIQIKEDEKQIRSENSANLNALAIPSLRLKAQVRRTDEWAQRVHDVYCDVWRIQGRLPTPGFLRALYTNAIRTLIVARTDAVIGELTDEGTRTGYYYYSSKGLKSAISGFDVEMKRLLGRWKDKIEIDAKTLEHTGRAVDSARKPSLAALPRTKNPEPVRRVNPTSAAFDKFAGRLMHKAHEKLIAQDCRPTKGRTLPNLPLDDFLRIVRRVDKSLIKSKARFPLQKVLTQRVWKKIADHNQRCSKSEGTIKTFADAAKNPKFKRQIHYRFNRAERFYRQHFGQK